MSKPKLSLIPDHSFKCITGITPDFLEQIGIRFLMLDLDNTIAAYDEHVFADNISKWISDIQNVGVELFIISNSSRKHRVKSHSDSIGVRFVMKSQKPSTKSLLHAVEVSGYKPDTSALAGDQILTDTIAANRAGIVSIIVRPRRFTNPFLAIRYFCELPFRAMCKNKH
ncbi:MAG: YqeG family HAD IIIA-type phosphatase [Oscillospiraceae bacterium]|nr:YqeG family HAD IIIA-type phosphatase [Oscillospiraceae bacterium]